MFFPLHGHPAERSGACVGGRRGRVAGARRRTSCWHARQTWRAAFWWGSRTGYAYQGRGSARYERDPACSSVPPRCGCSVAGVRALGRALLSLQPRCRRPAPATPGRTGHALSARGRPACAILVSDGSLPAGRAPSAKARPPSASGAASPSTHRASGSRRTRLCPRARLFLHRRSRRRSRLPRARLHRQTRRRDADPRRRIPL